MEVAGSECSRASCFERGSWYRSIFSGRPDWNEQAAAQDYLPYDCIVIDVRSAIDLLGEITGDTVQDEIINEIFERFCIGK